MKWRQPNWELPLMNTGHVANRLSNQPVPLIGKCPKCRAEIFASHPYAWCVKCGEKLPYRLNMERRPIMYEKSAVWPFAIEAESKDN